MLKPFFKASTISRPYEVMHLKYSNCFFHLQLSSFLSSFYFFSEEDKEHQILLVTQNKND
jgi:hypothetical protein